MPQRRCGNAFEVLRILLVRRRVPALDVVEPQVVEPARVHPLPLAPAGLAGLLHHGRALHPVLDAAALLGQPAAGDPRVLLLLDAGGSTAGVLVDRVRGVGEGDPGGPVRRPAWDALDGALSPG